MKVFAQLRAQAEFRRRNLAFLETLEDQEIVREIGHHQVLGAPLTLKQLVASGLGSVATLQRRLTRLKKLGVVLESRSPDDRRAVELTLSPASMRAFSRLGVLLAEAPVAAAARRTAKPRAMHICALCEGPGCEAMAHRFFREGLRDNQRCLFIGAQGACEAMAARIARIGRGREVDLACVPLAPDAEPALDYLEEFLVKARHEGRTARILGNWVGGSKLQFERIADYERRCDPLIRRFRAQVLCQYTAKSFTGEQILRALQLHPDNGRYPVPLA